MLMRKIVMRPVEILAIWHVVETLISRPLYEKKERKKDQKNRFLLASSTLNMTRLCARILLNNSFELPIMKSNRFGTREVNRFSSLYYSLVSLFSSPPFFSLCIFVYPVQPQRDVGFQS